MITVYDNAPEENNEYAEPQTCEGDGIRLYFRAVGELVKTAFGGIFTIGEYSHACRLQASLTRSSRRMQTHILLCKASSSRNTTNQKRTDNRKGYLFFFGRSGG